MIVEKFSQRFKDVVLELRIKIAFANLLLSTNGDQAARYALEHSRLCKLRSPSQAARMERKRRLS